MPQSSDEGGSVLSRVDRRHRFEPYRLKPCRLGKRGDAGNISGQTYFLRKWNPLPNVPLTNHQGKTVVEFRGFLPQLVA